MLKFFLPSLKSFWKPNSQVPILFAALVSVCANQINLILDNFNLLLFLRVDFKMGDSEVPAIPNEELLEVSPRDFEDSDDLLPHSSFQSDQAEGDYDEDEINYMNVSPVSERERDSDESEDDEVNLVNCLPSVSQGKSPQKVKEELEADSLCMEGKTLLWDLLQDDNIVSHCYAQSLSVSVKGCVS